VDIEVEAFKSTAVRSSGGFRTRELVIAPRNLSIDGLVTSCDSSMLNSRAEGKVL